MRAKPTCDAPDTEAVPTPALEASHTELCRRLAAHLLTLSSENLSAAAEILGRASPDLAWDGQVTVDIGALDAATVQHLYNHVFPSLKADQVHHALIAPPEYENEVEGTNETGTSTLPSAPKPPPATTFSSLPPELLGQIWSHLEHDSAGKRHVCRSLVPFVRRNAFRAVQLTSWRLIRRFDAVLHPVTPKGIRRLRRTTKDDRPLHELVHELSIWPIEFVADYCEHDDETQAARRILASCSRVRELTLSGSGLIRVLLPSHRGQIRLPLLEKLTLDELDGEYVSLWDAACFSRLCRFPALRTLEVLIEWEWDEEDSDYLATPKRAGRVSQIEHLSLYAGDSLATPAAANFISRFTQLRSLCLTLRGLADLGSFLQACPTTLERLSIAIDDDWNDNIDDPDEHLQLDADLARFSRLTHLSLGERTFSPSSELLPILAAHVPALEELAFGPGTHSLVAAKLAAYLAPPPGTPRALRRPPGALRRVVLDSFDARVGIVPSEQGLEMELDGVAVESFRIRDHWALAPWTLAFSLADARELVRVADAVGVALEGTLREAIQVEDLREREEKYLQERRDDVLLVLRSLFGDDEDGE
ncbi:hypothetical protein Rhopal_002664-T1 [Rhodotorula paludigena]|uniref:NET domain-containing protein n=1 Tax=Rhodotorula paludigena TaxID=86838 RepID=A0AAV5GKV5_9BASI|nr:hypothetical protein Rhopal_002664-T1 [Rhodotorula paludigena]